jgi:antitoxin MazE
VDQEDEFFGHGCGRIIIQPSDRVEYDLDALVEGISADNVHEEVGFGKPVGREAL